MAANNKKLILDHIPASSSSSNPQATEGKLFNLKKWNAVAMWSWDVECDTCAICRVQVCNMCRRSERGVNLHKLLFILPNYNLTVCR